MEITRKADLKTVEGPAEYFTGRVTITGQFTEGVGWTQIEGGPVLEFHAGDILWCPAEHKHWHGATPHEAMTHIALQESLDGSPVTWMEHVTDAQYLAGPAGE